MVILRVHLDKGFPVEVIFGGKRLVVGKAFKRHVLGHAQFFQVALHIALGVKQQAIPTGQLGLVQVQARCFGEMRRPQQLAFGVVSPAVQVAHHVVAIATAFVNQGLAVAAHIGNELDVTIDIFQHFAVALPA